MRKISAFNLAAIGLGLLFLYLPIAVLVIGSFKASPLGGWSAHQYTALAGGAALRQAALVSIRLALVAATLATVLGTLAAVALVHCGRCRGRLLLAALIYTPPVMPHIIGGLAMLLLFAAVSIDRGFWTVVIAHTTVATGFVALIVQARLTDLDPRLEEAAMDLGATPLDTFRAVTLPLLLPAVVAAWLIAFTLSLGDVVLASFTAAPGATTLPMQIYAAAKLGVTPQMNAVCCLMIGVIGLAVIAASLLTRLNTASR
jgi:putrescine transport system permease protein